MQWTDEYLDAQRLIGDPAADAVVDRLVAEFGAAKAREVFTLLIRHVGTPLAELPPYVAEFFELHGKPPADVDMARVVRGQKVFVDFGSEFAVMNYFKSLPTTYLNFRLAKTLSITGRLGGANWPEVFARRVAETTQFLLDVMQPGRLQAGGSGTLTALKVRLIHASIRHFITRSPEFDQAAWQLPISQEDLAYTLLTFNLSMVQGLGQMEIPLTAAQADDYYYAWRLVGHYLGIDPAMIPQNLAEAEAQQQVMFRRLVGSCEEGREITKALMDFSREIILPTELFDNSPEFLVRFYLGDEHAAVLGVQEKKGCSATLLPRFLLKYFRWLEKFEDRGLGRKRAANQIGLAVIRGMMKRFRSVKGRGLTVPEEMAQAWGL